MKLNLSALPAKLEMNPFGDRAIVLSCSGETGSEGWLAMAAAAARIADAKADWIVDIVPAYATVTVVYDPVRVMKTWQLGRGGGIGHGSQMPYEIAATLVEALLEAASQSGLVKSREIIEVPVCYGEAFGPDLAACAARSGITAAEFAEMHAGGDYAVALIGFMPGFPYMAGLPEKLAQPRRDTPRGQVPAGSVGIAGIQTGIYPFDSPGGWQIIGRTPLTLFRPDRPQPVIFQAGDRVRFIAVSEPEFHKHKEEEGRRWR